QKVAPELRQAAIESVTASGIRLLCQLERSNYVYGDDRPHMTFSADGTLLTSFVEGGLRVWRIPGGEIEGTHGFPYNSVRFGPVAPLLAIADRQEVCLWEPLTNRKVAAFPGQPPLHFNPTGKLLAFVRQGSLGLWDIAGGREMSLTRRGEPVGFVT